MKKRLLGLMAAVFALAASAFAFSACDLGGGNTGDTDNTGGNTQVPDDGNNDNPSGGEHTVHSYTEKNTDDKYLKSKATCKNKAVYYFSCSCGEKGNATFEYGELADHTEVIDKAVEPTCTKAGKTAGKHCSVCNKVLVEQTVIPAAHKEVIDEEIPATCTTDGKTEGSHCSVCNTVLVKQKVIPASGHNYETTTVDATQTAHGSATYTCSGCGKTYTEVLHNILEGECTVCHGSTAAVSYQYVNSNRKKYYAVSGLNDKTATNIIILSTYDDGEHGKLPVTSIGGSAFFDCSGFTSMVIPNSVTSIGSQAFYGCSGLTSIVIPNSVTSIGWDAFYGCNGLTSITVGEGNQNYASQDGILYNKAKTKFEHIPKAISGAVTIPDGVTNIGNSAFWCRRGLTSITIPDGVTSIGDSAFGDCSGLTSIVIPDSVTSIGESAFLGCSGLTSIVIPDSVTSIGRGAFRDCSGLTSITVGNGVTSIGRDAFRGCSGLTSITVGNGVTSIVERAFWGCSGLTSIYFTGNIADWCKISGLDNIMSYGVSGKELFIGGQEIIGELIIPNDVTSIGEYAFDGCSGLTSIVIPNSVTSIGKDAFYGCRGLMSIEIPNSVTSIGREAFNGCYGLTSVVIPNSVTSIGDSAFRWCIGLTSITMGNGVTSIGQYAFDGCSGLTSITIGNSVTSIGYSAFYDCSGLTIYCEATEEPEGWNNNWNSSNCPVVWGYTGEE